MVLRRKPCIGSSHQQAEYHSQPDFVYSLFLHFRALQTEFADSKKQIQIFAFSNLAVQSGGFSVVALDAQSWAALNWIGLVGF